MVIISIENIEELYDEGEREPSGYIIEYTIPEYPNTYRTEQIPAQEFDRETAKEEVKRAAGPLIGSQVAVTVEFPEVSENQSAESRRDVLKYWVGGMTTAGLLGAGWWLSRERRSTQAIADGTPTATPVNSPAVTETEAAVSPENSPTATESTPTASADWAGLIDGFEDGDIDEWQVTDPEGEGLLSASQEEAAEGELAAKMVKEIDSNTYYARSTEPVLKPSRVETSMYVDGDREVKTLWDAGDKTAFWLTVDFWNSPSAIRWSSNQGSTLLVGPKQNQWYHLVVKGIDWESHLVGEVLINDTSVATELAFDADVSSIDSVRIGMKGATGGTGYWDTIRLYA